MSSYMEKMRKKIEATGGNISSPTVQTPVKEKEEVNFETIPDSLEELETQITELNSKVWINGWHIGKRLSKINADYLTQLQYDNFYDYVYDKFGFKKTTAYNLIYISATYSQFHAREHGAKLRLLQPLPKEDQQKYLEWMDKEKPTFREVENKIRSESTKKKTVEADHFEDIKLGNTKITINLKGLGVKIPKEDTDRFLKGLEDYIKTFK